jgi:hypothetical protein
MKVIFLDFDGVLNSSASFRLMSRKKDEGKFDGKIHEHLCELATNNFQMLLKRFPEVKVVISSTWREYYDLDWLREKLNSFAVDGSRVIDRTPKLRDRIWTSVDRGVEIDDWLSKHPEVTHYVILDDNSDMTEYQKANHFVHTNWNTGFTLDDYEKASEILHKKRSDVPETEVSGENEPSDQQEST